jgi:anti-sigma factor RsiW
MSCVDPKELSAYVDGELAEEKAASIREHLARCAACREELSRLEFVSETLELLQGAEPDPYFAPRLKRLAVAERGRGWARRAFVPAAAAAAAALSLVLGAFLGKALYAEPDVSTSNGNGVLAAYLGVSPLEDFPDGSLGEAWGDVWTQGDNE